ncbi:hypothetical protein [Neobacillus sp. Marseille-QA0830]
MDKNQLFTGKQQEEVLEISPTGYGLESVKKENEEETKQKVQGPSCGGL